MINLYDQVPSVYSNASRDFQYLSWLFNIVLNSVKHNVDAMYDLPNTKNDLRLTELLAMTLGFKVKRNYDQKQLAVLVSILPSLLKYKGTEKAIKMAGDALVLVSGSAGGFSCITKGNLLEVVIPKGLIDITLFIDLLPYILPAGMTCKIVRKTEIKENLPGLELHYGDYLQAAWYEDLGWEEKTQTSAGLAGLFNSGGNSIPNFTNYNDDAEGLPPTLNAGLLDNTVIPILKNTLVDFKKSEEDEEK